MVLQAHIQSHMKHTFTEFHKFNFNSIITILLYVSFNYSSRIQQIATGDYLTRKFSNFVRKGGFDRQLSGGGEGWHGKKGGSMNIETFVSNVLMIFSYLFVCLFMYFIYLFICLSQALSTCS